MSSSQIQPVGGSSAGRRFLVRLTMATCVITVIGASIAVYRQAAELTSARAQIAKMQREAQIQALMDNLSAPSEVVLSDHQTINQIMETRRKGWERQGVKTFILYNHIIGATCGTSLSHDPSSWKEYDAANANTSYEYELLNRIPWLCQQLASELESNSGLGKYFNENKDDFNKRMRPILARLLKAGTPAVICNACKALLAAGDRSNEVVAAMRRFEAMHEGMFPHTRGEVRALGRKYCIDVGGDIPAKYLAPQDAADRTVLLHFDPATQVLNWLIPEKGKEPWDHLRLVIVEGDSGSGQIIFDKETAADGRMTIDQLNEIARPRIDTQHGRYAVSLSKFDKAGNSIGNGYAGSAVLCSPTVPGAVPKPAPTTRND